MAERKKWEYQVLDWHTLPEVGYLDGMGQMGWELVSVLRDEKKLKYYFKRELQEFSDE